MTLQTAAEHKSTEKRNRKIPLKATARWHEDSKGQLEELLSYDLQMDIGVYAFVAIDNDEDEDGDAKYN